MVQFVCQNFGEIHFEDLRCYKKLMSEYAKKRKFKRQKLLTIIKEIRYNLNIFKIDNNRKNKKNI